MVNHASLRRITKALEGVLLELKNAKLSDRAIPCKYAEYLVAQKLAKRGHTVQLLNRRDNSADIFLLDIGKRVEVKSCRVDEDGWANASFSEGHEIQRKRFDYCVWVIMDDYGTVKHTFIFTVDELKEVCTKRPKLIGQLSNQCLLLLAPSLKDFNDYVTKMGEPVFRVEKDLLNNPAKYRDAWLKIK
jgi:hypothetical protein